MTGVGQGASSTTVVSMSVPSATNLTSTGCASGTANVTDFGVVQPGSSIVSGADCSLAWGSSNDTAMLRIWQQDIRGVAMSRPTSGVLDTTFDGDGKATVPRSQVQSIHDILVQPDGKIIVGGSSCESCGSPEFYLARFNSNGSLDTSFDTDGFVATDINTAEDSLYALALQPDGKIIAAGTSNGAARYGVVRYNANGSLDTTFSGDGILEAEPPGSGADIGRAVALQPDGRILVAGRTNLGAGYYRTVVFRLLADGTLDSTFDTDGYQVHTVPGCFQCSNDVEAMLLRPDGTILLVGSTDAAAGNTPPYDVSINRYTDNGALDATFDGDGVAITSLTAGNDHAYGAALLPDGRIVVTGTIGAAGATDAFVARFTDAGALDTTFDGDGWMSYSTSAGDDHARGITYQADGKLLITGHSTVAGARQLTTARITSTGTLDPTFGSGGIASYATGAWSEGQSIEYLADGKFLLGGTDSSNDFLLMQLAGTPVPDYTAATSDWTAGTSMFGACLRSVAGAGVTATWTANATCPATDGAWWNAVPATSAAPGAKIAASTTSGTTTATANLRFGVRTATTQSPGTYVAPVTFEVVAPNA